MTLLEKAIHVAMKAHEGQKDKAGMPYILHPLRVMLKMDTEAGMIAAVLHDLLEDTDLTPEDLIKEGIAGIALEAIEAVTKKDKEPYDEYIERIKQNPIARKVKLADLEDNMDITRLPELSLEDIDRLAKYHEAWLELKK
jgi:(p)ppGpp synthase/HD superfamily hydrolase